MFSTCIHVFMVIENIFLILLKLCFFTFLSHCEILFGFIGVYHLQVTQVKIIKGLVLVFVVKIFSMTNSITNLTVIGTKLKKVYKKITILLKNHFN